MADTITIEGVPGYNGEYPLDITYFTNRELHLIKKVSGVRAGELTEAFNAGDNDLMVAVAAIAIQRHTHKDVNVDALWDAEAGKFTFNMETVEARRATMSRSLCRPSPRPTTRSPTNRSPMARLRTVLRRSRRAS